MALIYVLREPLGVILVVLAFLVASFFIDPFQQLVGLPKEHALDAGAVVSAVLGTLLCLAQLSLPVAHAVLTRNFWAGFVRAPAAACAQLCEGSSSSVGGLRGGSPDSATAYAALTPPSPIPSKADRGAVQTQAEHDFASNGTQDQGEQDSSIELRPMLMEDPPQEADGGGAASSRMPASGAVHTLGVLAAFGVLALTAGIGIVITTYFEKRAGLNMFGYAAIDQVLLPVTSLPIAWLLYQWPAALHLLGEPAADIAASRGGAPGTGRSFWGVMTQTWAEMKPHIFSTLLPYRGTMFAREFVFFYLATAFSDINSVYLTMTLVRVVLCWLASLLACSYLSKWVGISKAEAAATLHPANLILRGIGSALIVLAIVRLSSGG